MKQKLQEAASFTLMEVTLALGIAAFSLIAVLGLLPIGLQGQRQATAQTESANILSAVVMDLRATPKTVSTSVQFGIPLSGDHTLYFDSQGRHSTSPTANSLYLVTVHFLPAGSSPIDTIAANVKLTWPALAAPNSATGTSETFAVLNRL